MRVIRVIAVAVVFAGSLLLSSDTANAATNGFCGVCGCPSTQGGMEGACATVCGGGDSIYCTWSPFCHGSSEGGPLLVCFPNVE